MLVRYVGLPRSVVNELIGDMEGWRQLGHRILERAKATCPVSDSSEGVHLVDTLMIRFITGTDPRMMIGSSAKGDVLAYVHDGTSAHDNYPVNAKVLHWIGGDGEDVFATHSHTPARAGRPFILDAARAVVQSK